MKTLNHRAGFTLLEIMVALSIVAIVFITAFRLHSQTISMSGRVRFDAVAPLLAQEKLSEYERMSSESLLEESGDFGDKLPGYRWSVSVADVESEPLGELSKDLKRLDLVISSVDGGTAYRIRAYRFARGSEADNR